MKIERICFYVDDAKQWQVWFVQVMGFGAIATSIENDTHTEVIRSGAIVLVLSSPLTDASPVADYLQKHPPGVVNIEFVVPNLETILTRMPNYGGTVLTPIQTHSDRRYCQIQSHAGITHTLWEKTNLQSVPNDGYLFHTIDHIVLNVAVGQLQPTVDWYCAVFGFECQQTFNIQTARSGLHSQVMIHPESGLKLPVNEPTSCNSQIQEFLNENNGAGVQHIALNTQNIIATTAKLREVGVRFLNVPTSYYCQLRSQFTNLPLLERDWSLIEQEKILVDCQFPLEKNPPILLQIFTKPIFSTPTFFFEIIERRQQAEGFGEGNFRALFQAIEREQMQRES